MQNKKAFRSAVAAEQRRLTEVVELRAEEVRYSQFGEYEKVLKEHSDKLDERIYRDDAIIETTNKLVRLVDGLDDPSSLRQDTQQALREAFRSVGNFLQQASRDMRKPQLTLPSPGDGSYEMWRDRADKNEKPLDFLRRVWGGYIDAGVMYQTDLRGGVNKEPLDKRLFDLCWQQCKDDKVTLNDYVPNKSKQIDRELEEENFNDFNKLMRLKMAKSRRRNKKDISL